MSLFSAKLFFENHISTSAKSFEVLAQSGSSRTNYIGQSKEQKFIITQNENLRENEAFFYLSDVFSQLHINTPKVLKINKERNIYIQEFLGEKTLSEIIAQEEHSPKIKSLVKKTLELLFELQQKTKNKIDFTQTFEYEKYDELPITHDLYYFKNFLIDVLEIPYHKGTLLKEFKNLTFIIEKLSPQSLMLRDFQARNIMVDGEKISFIDYQSAMEGPAIYDVVSFLFQAKANFPTEWKKEMLEYYINFWEEEEQAQLWEALPYCQLIRFLQVLGAYGFRGIIQQKPHFKASLNQGIKNIHLFFEQWEDKKNYPELTQLIEKLSQQNLNL
ncbi:MAG: phosphotransferase [Flavobacteriaceae bacterium]|nr:phosphotransferase [Flavobacteriaceae bacterium]